MAPGTILRQVKIIQRISKKLIDMLTRPQRALAPAIAGISAAFLMTPRPTLHAESAPEDAQTLLQTVKQAACSSKLIYGC
jgi:hypothetical protein